MRAALASSIWRITLPGEPNTSERGGISLPSPINVPAPIRQPSPILAPLSTMAPMPISEPAPIVQPCSMTMWPIVQSAPMLIGKPGSVCSTDPSWMFEPRPMTIGSLSPRMTLPNQTLASSSMVTLPSTTALSATQ